MFNPFGNTEASTAAARGTGDSQGIESFVYDASGQDVNCIVAGTATQQTTCPTGPLPSGYATNLAPAGEPPSHDPIACFRASLES